jgi:flagellar biosynthesis GTPase FlhF
MEMKTFEAFTMRDALKAVKNHFGQDAVILGSREKKLEGSKGKIYEVTAARNATATVKGASRGSQLDPVGMKDNLIEMILRIWSEISNS